MPTTLLPGAFGSSRYLGLRAAGAGEVERARLLAEDHGAHLAKSTEARGVGGLEWRLRFWSVSVVL